MKKVANNDDDDCNVIIIMKKGADDLDTDGSDDISAYY